MKLIQNQKTQQTLSTRMLQSVKILQMSAQELRQYADEVMLGNPMLEHEEEIPEQEISSYDSLQWEIANDEQNTQYYAGDDDFDDPLANLGNPEKGNTLFGDLLSQFGGLQFESELFAAIRFLVERLDEDGRLEEDIASQAAQAGIASALFHRALTELQAAEPAGVGARSLEECLRLQIARQAGDHRLAERIAAEYLPDFARGRFAQIAKACDTSVEAVMAACAMIRRLNPHPCAGFASYKQPQYVIPDVRLTLHGDHFEIVPNPNASPRLRLNSYYLHLMQETGDREVRDYLIQKSNQAKWVLHSIFQRQETILRCVQCVAERQSAFLRSRENPLKTLTMQEVANQLGMHESTVSRAIREKYVQTPSGVYPLNALFTHTRGENEASPETVQRLLKALIENETVPLSDQQLCERIRQQGCKISRRTVAKYRAEIGIPSAKIRRAQQ